MTRQHSDAAAIILAGGKSTRLGRDKASEVLRGRSLLQRAADAFAGLVEECVVVRAKGQALPAIESKFAVTIVEDTYPEAGPLVGIYTGLTAMRASYGVVVACDMPLLQPALLSELLRLTADYDIVVPVNEGLAEPLCAAYSKACVAAIEKQIEAGNLKATSFHDDAALRVLRLEPAVWRQFDPEELSFRNLNRQSDLETIEALLAP